MNARDQRRLTTILWDFDGTLANTSHRNYRITQRIVRRVTGRDDAVFAPLRSFDHYVAASQRVRNWRELYITEFGLTERETDEAGVLWTSYQLEDDTHPRLYDGIRDVLARLSDLPHGIVSQNARAYIAAVLGRENLAPYFAHVVGYEEVGFDRQKPAPDGLLMCLDTITGMAPGHAVYIGDHETDIQCAANANAELEARGLDLEVIAIGALYGFGGDAAAWDPQPHHRAREARDILDIVASYGAT